MGFKTMLSGLLMHRGRTVGIHSGTGSEMGGDSYDFALSGSLDRRSAPGIRKVMFEEALRHREVRIDLAGLRLVDSAGLAILVEVFAAAKRGGVDMAFHRPSEPMRRVLRFTRLDEVFPIVDSLALPSRTAAGRVGRATGSAARPYLRPSPTGA